MMKMFTKEYWGYACRELKDIRKMVLAALLCAIIVIIDVAVPIPVLPGGLTIKFTFFIVALGCAIYGPIIAIIVAVASDVIAWLFSSYAFHIGYMLTEIVVALFFCLFLYRQKITIMKLFAARFCANFLAHLPLNSIWDMQFTGQGYLALLWSRLIKNMILLPIEVFILAGFFSYIIPSVMQMSLLPIHSKEEVDRLRFNWKIWDFIGFYFCTGGAALIYIAYLDYGNVFWWIGAGCLLVGIVLIAFASILNHRNKKKKANI